MVLVGGVSSAACSGGGGDGDGDASDVTTTTRSADSPGTTDPDITIVLAPARLTVGGNALPFGAPDFQVSSFLERALGEPAEDEDQQCDAGPLRVIEWPSLTAYVGAEGFAGWSTDEDAHETDKGVAVGASASELQAAYATGQTTESSLGTEFFFDAGEGRGMSALIESGEVATLWSGATCIAR